jgi:2-octaprenyl-6-methoxyphenol hydroxylase
MASEAVDILIAGGGPVGAALALALEGSGHSVVLAEARSADSGAATSDARAIALSYASRLILERLHAWPALASTPIETIHISQRGGFGRTLISAAECGLPALGYVANYDDLQRSLLAVPCSARRLFGARLTGFDGSIATLQTQEGVRVFAPRLTVFADGARVPGGDAAPGYSKDYRQTALAAWVKTAQEPRGRAWERFTNEGPLALLPHAAGYALVWTTDPDRGARLAAFDTPAFLAQLQASFGERLGAFIDAGAKKRSRTASPSATQRKPCTPSQARDSTWDCATHGNSPASCAIRASPAATASSTAIGARARWTAAPAYGSPTAWSACFPTPIRCSGSAVERGCSRSTCCHSPADSSRAA